MLCQTGYGLTQHLRAQISASPDSDPQAAQEAMEWCTKLAEQLLVAQTAARTLIASFVTLSDAASRLTTDMEFGFLFDAHRQLFHIGYNVEAGMLDQNYYDLLASEARIASLVAIAKYDVPQSHWIHLGRPLTRT